ncbi:MAG: aldehyde dehydrogenase family protein [Acidimicrobiales bacterium]|nr:aldehyde dehydrogenase family protein [Acidimicrobiales bacterium]
MTAFATPPETRESSIESIDPRDGAVVGSVPIHDEAAVDAAVARARTNQVEWGATTLSGRSTHLRRVRAGIARRSKELAEVIAAETGKPDFDAMAEVLSCCVLLTQVIRRAPKVLADERVSSFPLYVKRAEIRYEPYGVIGVISPWNYPAFVPVQALSSALAAGNTAVLKPSELTPLTGLLLGEIINEAGIPLVEVVTGDGATGAALSASAVDKIAFTGSPATAKRILATAAEHLTPTVMELGGKDAMILCDDADVERAARTAVAGCFANAGQTCIAVERVLVTPANHAAFREAAVRAGSQLVVGPERNSDVGAITQPAQIDVIERRIEDAVSEGAAVVLGGRRRDDLGQSFFEPTIVDNVRPTMALARDETFGPVLSIIPVADVEESVRVANDCEYGLAGSVFGRDRARVEDVVRQFSTGAVSVNDALVTALLPSLPFGGVRSSGFGRLHGDAGIREFAVPKAVAGDRLPRLPGLTSLMFGKVRPTPAQVSRLLGLLWGRSPRRE